MKSTQIANKYHRRSIISFNLLLNRGVKINTKTLSSVNNGLVYINNTRRKNKHWKALSSVSNGLAYINNTSARHQRETSETQVSHESSDASAARVRYERHDCETSKKFDFNNDMSDHIF